MRRTTPRQLENYLVDAATGCWLWQGARKARGSKDLRPGHGATPTGEAAHRAMWNYLFNTHLKPEQELVRKATCPHWHCINPDHHEIGTQVEVGCNMRDRGTQTHRPELARAQMLKHFQTHKMPPEHVRAMHEGRRRTLAAREAAGLPKYPGRTPESTAIALAKRAATLATRKASK